MLINYLSALPGSFTGNGILLISGVFIMFDFNKTRFEKIIYKIRPRWTYSFFWNDIKFKYYKIPRYKNNLMKGQNFVSWDIVNSICELTFRQFEIFWGEYGHNRYDDNKYLKRSKKEQKHWYNSIIIQEKIFRYISEIRAYNSKLLEKTLSDQWEYIRTYSVPTDEKYNEEKCYLMKTEYLEGYFDIKYSFNRKDLLSIEKIKPDKSKRLSAYTIEEKLENIDDKYLKMIIDNRRYMWD